MTEVLLRLVDDDDPSPELLSFEVEVQEPGPGRFDSSSSSLTAEVDAIAAVAAAEMRCSPQTIVFEVMVINLRVESEFEVAGSDRFEGLTRLRR